MRLGIDLGGTKIEGVVLDAADGTAARLRIPTPPNDYRAIIGAVTGVVEQLERRVGRRCSVGVGMPGAISPHTGRVKNANTTVLNGKDLSADLCAALDREVRFANDANCLALSEAVDGAGAGQSIVFGAILGTGTGGGVVVDRRLLTGPNAIAGEWGHNPLPWPEPDELPGPQCYCGKRGCLETFLSGAGLQLAYRQTGGAEHRRAVDIASLADRGDDKALGALRRYAQRLARGLASDINVLDPDVVVLGGGLSQINQLYTLVPAALPDFVFSDTVDTAIRPAHHGDSSGVRGAAWLWPLRDGAGAPG